MIVYRVGNYLDDNLDQFYVFLLLSDGVLRLADVLQSENLFFLLNFSSSPCLLDRRAVLLTSCDVLSPLGSRGAVFLPHVLDGGPQSSVNNGIFIVWTCLDRCHVWTDVMFGQMSYLDRCPDRTGQDRCWVRTNVLLGQMSCWDKCRVGTNVVRTNVVLGQMSC